MNITNTLKSHGTTVTQFAAILGLSRNRTYNFMNLYEKGLKVSNKYAYQWAFEYLFNNELSDEEFILRMNEIRIKLTENKIQNAEQKIYTGKVLELGQNNYIIYDNIKHFEFEAIKSNNGVVAAFKLTIDGQTYMVGSEVIQNLCKHYNIKIK